ncbi:MAG: D-tyrosyl-tRNA(Tyr) deacylase [Bryobacterales bacterium]|nr:D-tyrosyl-tRNA(Tyr) deacylase [Bryobacterales bacterium]
MRAVVQRVSQAWVDVENRRVSGIEAGLLVFAGVGRDDTAADAEYLARKIVGLRVFPNTEGKMDWTLGQAGGALLVVSQFTLWGDVRKGNRPSFDQAAPAEEARRLYEYLVNELSREGVVVRTGIFQARMEVGLVNQGPVTILLDSKKQF